MTSFDYSGVMWAEATRDREAEETQELQLRGKLATASFWPFLAAAESETDFGHRLVLIEDRIAAVVAPPVLSSVLASVASDWKLLHTARLEASAQAERERLRQAEAHRAAQPQQVRADDEIFDVSQGRWVRVSYIDPSDAQRYSHYPNMNPPVDNGPLQGPDGFVTGGEGDAGRSDAVIQQRQLTPGQWTVTPGTEWPVRPNAADPTQVPRTAAEHVAANAGLAALLTNMENGDRRSVSTHNGHSYTIGYNAEQALGDDNKPAHGYTVGSYDVTHDQSGRNLGHYRHSPYGPSLMGAKRYAAEQAAAVIQRHAHDQQGHHGSRRQAGEGIVPTPGPNPNYFSQGSEGIAGPPTFPENPSSAIEPKTDNRMDDLYGAVPPQASSGSAQGLVDGQGYSKQVPGSSATAGRRTAGHIKRRPAQPGTKCDAGDGDHLADVHLYQTNPTFGDEQSLGDVCHRHDNDEDYFDSHEGSRGRRPFADRTAGTNGRIVGHCDHCNQPVRYHTGENGVDELRHLHNNHNSCSNGQKAASLARSAAFFDPKDATVRVLADGMTRARPTLDNPSGAGDEYDANTWNNAVTQRPMQSAEDRGINTPTQPREPIGTVSSEPGRGDDDDRNQNGMARETSLAARSIEELMES